MGERSVGLSPGAAAETLEVSPQTLRRYAAQYEQVFGSLERRNGQRLFTQEVLERLQAAQALVSSGQAGGMRGALESIRNGPPQPVGLPRPPTPDPELLQELSASRLEIAAARESMKAALEAAVAAHREAAEARESPAAARADLAAVRRELASVREAVVALEEGLSAMRSDLDRLVGAMLELSGRQVEGAEAMAERLDSLREELLTAAFEAAEDLPPIDAPGAIGGGRRRWWRFWE